MIILLFTSSDNILCYCEYHTEIIFWDTDDREDRRISYLRAVDLLKGGGSIMIYPEGARNGSENLPVMPLFPGTAKMSLKTDTPVVPVAIEQYDKRFVINFGRIIYPTNFQGRDELTQTIRDALATLKWEIWEREGVQTRSSLPGDYRKQFIKQFEERIYPYDTPATIERSRFHTREEMEQRDAFLFLDRLVPRWENAFLFRNH